MTDEGATEIGEAWFAMEGGPVGGTKRLLHANSAAFHALGVECWERYERIGDELRMRYVGPKR